MNCLAASTECRGCSAFQNGDEQRINPEQQ